MLTDKVEDDSWQQSTFGHTQESSNSKQALEGLSETHSHSNDTPNDSEDSQPIPGGEFPDDKVRWDFGGDVEGKEDGQT